jgi:hypothetical protein
MAHFGGLFYFIHTENYEMVIILLSIHLLGLAILLWAVKLH